MADYVRYQDYYRDNFIPEFKRAYTLLENECSAKDMREGFLLLFGASFLLLKYYLHNNGLFQFRETDVLREAFCIEILDNGEEWMRLAKLYNNCSEKEIENILKDYFFVFENLKNKFEELV